MAILPRTCQACRAMLDDEDLFCGTCGTAAEADTTTTPSLTGVTKLQTFDCSGCGASMSYDAAVKTLKCPFCGSTGLTEQPAAPALIPQSVVPFLINRSQATQLLRDWLGRGFWRPGDLAESATIDQMFAVLVPYWVFSGTTHTYWTADTNITPAHARSQWYPLTGEYHGVHEGILVAASSVLTHEETTQLSPFDLISGVAPEQVNYEGTVVERLCVPRKHARPLAQGGLEAIDRLRCMREVPGSCRNLRTNTLVEGLRSVPVLLPVWILAYRYRGAVHRFLINGQTGRASGTAPTDYLKVACVVIGILVAGLLLLLLMALATKR
jgi:hypothetical protein